MYKTHFLCTYHLLNLIEDENEPKEELLENQNLLYQIQILEAFGFTNTLNIDKHLNAIEYQKKVLYQKYKSYEQIQNIIKNHKLYANNDEEIFTLLFSYDTFYIFHKCLIDLEQNNLIHNDNYSEVINCLKTMKI